jgi:hypothetical protein
MMERFDLNYRLPYERYVLDIIRLKASAAVDADIYRTAQVRSALEYISDRLVFQMELALAGKEHIVSYPENWWEAVKERFAPRWFRMKYPVKLRREKVYNVCPHLNVPQNHSDHIDFVMARGLEEFL